MTALIADRLRIRAHKAGAEPLITYYDLDSGVRIELSAVTFLNWVDKTSNLVTDEQLLEPGEVVELALAEAHPGHWVTAVWELACWQLGLVVSVGSGLPAALVVIGPEQVDATPRAGEAIACSLHPLGLGFDTALPPAVTDYAAEVRGQPDQFAPAPQSGLALAWADAERKVTQAELATGDLETRRRLLRPADPWTTCRDGILTALVSGGSVVTVVGEDSDRLERIAADERVDYGT